MHRSAVVVFVTLLLAMSATVTGGECLVLAFNQYCIGGDITELQRQRPDTLRQQQQGDRYGLVYAEGRGKLYVMANNNRIYKVLRQYKPASSSRYRTLRDELVRQYGMPQERSRLPETATGLAAKIGAIRRGEGEARLIWRLPGQHWRIELSWTRELGVALAYIDDGEAAAEPLSPTSGPEMTPSGRATDPRPRLLRVAAPG